LTSPPVQKKRAGVLVQLGEQVKQQGAAGLAEGQVAQLVQDDQVHAHQCGRSPAGHEHQALTARQQPVENGVSDGRIADPGVPMLDRQLTRDDRRARACTVIDDLHQVRAREAVHGGHAPAVKDQDGRSRWSEIRTRGFLRLLHDAAGRPDSYDTATDGVPGWFWQIACEEAHARRGDTRAYLLWLAGSAVEMGTGIWSIHFVGMLAASIGIQMTYHLGWTVLSSAHRARSYQPPGQIVERRYNTRRPHSNHQARTPDVVYFASLPQPSAEAA